MAGELLKEGIEKFFALLIKDDGAQLTNVGVSVGANSSSFNDMPTVLRAHGAGNFIVLHFQQSVVTCGHQRHAVLKSDIAAGISAGAYRLE